MEFKIVFIDDNLDYTDPFVQSIRKKFPNADCQNVFRDPQKGADFVLNNLNSKMIVFVDWNFGIYPQKGIDVLRQIREKTSLLYVVIMSANQLNTIDIPSESLIYMMNDENFFYLDKSNGDFEQTFSLINKIINLWNTKFDCILEDWLTKNPEDNEKIAYSEAGGKSYKWSDVLEGLRLQTEIGKQFERLINKYYIRKVNNSKK